MLVLIPQKRGCKIDGKEIGLSNTEYKVLEYLDKNRNRLTSAKEMKEKLWTDHPIKTRTVQTLLSRLNKKIGRPFYSVAYGGGYMLL